MAKKNAIIGGLAVLAAFVAPVLVGAGGVLPLSQNSVSVGVGKNVTVTAYAPNGQRANLVGNTNSFAAHANVSGSSLIIYGLDNGFSQLTFCTYDNYCGSVNVTVGDGSTVTPPPAFGTTSLSTMQVGNYYSYQLAVSGGVSPYTYSLHSGSLPSGIFLSSSGQIYGTPTNNTTRTFMVKVVDGQGRTAYSPNFTVSPQGQVSGAAVYNNGTLVNDGGTIYIIYKNTKSGFANMSAFTNLGYKTSNIIYASTANVANSGFVINNQFIAHPWGTWVKSGNTVYFVHKDGLIPVGQYSVFVGNGGVDAWVVPMNNYDTSKTVLPVMTPNDPRLK